MRHVTESLNAQLERAFSGQRLSAWGVHNQTTVVLLAAVAANAWARQVGTTKHVTKLSIRPARELGLAATTAQPD